MSVQININGENAAEAVKELSNLAAHFTLVPVTTPEAQQEDKPKRQRSAKQGEPAAAKPAAPAEEQDDSKAEVAGGDPGDSTGGDAGKSAGEDSGGEPIPTIVELRARAQEIGKTADGKKAIKALLDEFGSKSLSDVPEDKRADFMAGLDLI